MCENGVLLHKVFHVTLLFEFSASILVFLQFVNRQERASALAFLIFVFVLSTF